MDLGSGAYKNSTGLTPSGVALTAMPATIQKAVLQAAATTPEAASAVGSMSLDGINKLVGQVAKVAPTIAAAMSNPTQANVSAAQAAAAASSQGNLATQLAATLIATGEAAKWGITGALNPISAIARRTTRPVKILSENITLSGSGAGTITFSPQEAFEAFRLCVPSGQAAQPAADTLALSNLLAGDRLMFETTGSVPANCLRENADTGRIDFPTVSLGEQISALVSGGTANAEFAAALLGFGSRARVLPDGAEILYERLVPIPVTTVPGSGTGGGLATVTMQPQRHVIPRRLVFDDGVANFGSLWFQSFNIQDMPQFVGIAAEVPVQLFSEIAQDMWTDHDMCQLGGTMTIGLRNANANTVTFQGYLVCDVVRLAGEARR